VRWKKGPTYEHPPTTINQPCCPQATTPALVSSKPGVKLLGRWTRADLSGGFDILETDDAQKLFEFAYMWGTLMELEIIPVLDDQELKTALESATKWKPPFKTR
jgi:hypothetical protein